eukprot:13143341-Alexandrium_andersonii.AAC.1
MRGARPTCGAHSGSFETRLEVLGHRPDAPQRSDLGAIAVRERGVPSGPLGSTFPMLNGADAGLGSTRQSSEGRQSRNSNATDAPELGCSTGTAQAPRCVLNPGSSDAWSFAVRAECAGIVHGSR